MTAVAVEQLSYREYLERERLSPTKHEFLRGHVLAMAGGTPEHARLAQRVSRQLDASLGDRPCETFSSDLRVRILATDRATYPDVKVVCGRVEVAPDDPDAVINPTVIVEVLSDTTEADDRGEKWAHYRRIPSLREYVMVSQRAHRIEVFRREADIWTFREWGAGQVARLESIGADISVDEVYRNRLDA